MKLKSKILRPLARAYANRHPREAFDLVLSPLGYNNYKGDASGEKHFVYSILPRISPSLCLDVGANRGGYSRLLLEATETKVIAFEPLRIMSDALEKVRSQFDGRLEIVNCGIGDKKEMQTIHFSTDSASHASFLPESSEIEYIANQEKDTVEINTIDNFVKDSQIEDIDLIKIDVEGFEGKVLDGSANTIANMPPKIIQVENNIHQLLAQESMYSLSKRLKGYELFQLLPQSIVRRDPLSSEANLFVFSNFIFVRSDVVDLISM